jgi:thiosulfate dehydrogenase
MQALIAYVRYVGTGSPLAVRIAGMGLKALPVAAEKPDEGRGLAVFRQHCAECHGAGGEGQADTSGVGYAIPPLWGADSFNSAAGMANIEFAAAFVHANMPVGAAWDSPILTAQQAWDVAAFMTAQPRPVLDGR